MIKQKNKISKRIKCLFYVLHLFLGLDFGYIKRTPRTNMMLRFFCLAYNIFLCANIFIYLLYIDADFIILGFMLSMLFQHVFNSVVLATSDCSFYNLQRSLISLDTKLTLRKPIEIDNEIIVFCLVSALYRIIISYFYCTFFYDECEQTVLARIVTLLESVSNDILLIICFFMFYSVYLRLKILITMVDSKDCSVSESFHIYKSIVDMVNRIKKPFDFLYIVALMITTPNLIMTTYLGLSRLKHHIQAEFSIMDFITRSVYCAQDFALIFSPPISAGLLSSGVNSLKVILYDRLLQERYEDHVTTIEVFIAYVEEYPLRLSLFRLIRLDWSLPVTLANLCISYQILIVQLTKLY